MARLERTYNDLNSDQCNQDDTDTGSIKTLQKYPIS